KMKYKDISFENNYLVPNDLLNIRILVVDDNTSAREVLQGMLGSFSLNSSAVDSGQSAIEEIKRAINNKEKHYDMVLMDWLMPEMDGYQATKLIQQDQEISSFPNIVIVSAFKKEMITQKASDIAASIGYLSKPVSASTLLDTILKNCGRELEKKESENTKNSIDLISTISGSHILIVDDLEDNSEIVKEILEQRGIVITTAKNGQQAVDAVVNAAKSNAQFDAILMDIQMPIMDGFEATQHIRNMVGTKLLPIIAMSASAMVQDVKRCLEAGMNDHIAKPIDVQNLFTTIVKWVKPKTPNTEVTRKQDNNNDKQKFDIAIANLPGLDITTALKSMDGDKELLIKMILRFPKNNATTADEICKAIEENNFSNAQKLAHRLKGGAGNIAANDLSFAASEIEIAIRNGDFKKCNSLLQPLTQSMEIVLQSVKILYEKT
ncbi:MAG: response regulator, partial [Magnetococcales bacterium]|nr:response regulator [Magnetococcales bacterium]